ncbi:acylneuraminate cytidylyltransferase family protein [Clostridium sp. UBA871]|uniref:acylneuraminate cytidylyltransferase family protein n=1 Tax=Clostridium sp. UBA871 TaxID=1946380 RepID=UPI0032162428
MKTVALIPIKLGSKRVPKKNIKPFFDGTPLMTFIQRVCLESDRIDETYIYCSDESIKEYVLPGIKFLKRPEFLDGDSMNANDIIREFMKSVDADIYVNTHTTSPFAKVSTINTCVDKVASGEYDSAFCAESLKTFMWKDGKPINFDPDHFPRTQDLPLIYAETCIAYVFKKETFEKFDRRVGDNPFICEVGKIEAMDIDYPEDFEICDSIYKEVMSK